MQARLLVFHPHFSPHAGSGLGESPSPPAWHPHALPPPPTPIRAWGRTRQGEGKRPGPTSGTLGAEARVSPGKGVSICHAVRGLRTVRQSGGIGAPHAKSWESLATRAWEPSRHPTRTSSTHASGSPPPCRRFPHPGTSAEAAAAPTRGEWKCQGAKAPEGSLPQRQAGGGCITAPASLPLVLDDSEMCVCYTGSQRPPVGLGSCCPQPIRASFPSLFSRPLSPASSPWDCLPALQKQP